MVLSPLSLAISRFEKIRYLLFQLLIGMLGSTLVLLFFHLLEPPRQIVTVDVTSIITRFVKMEAESKLPKPQLQQQVNTFGEALDHTLKTIARDQQLILLPKEAVMAGARDISREVETRVNAQLAIPDTRASSKS